MTGLEAKKPPSRHTRSQSMQESSFRAAANAKVWATNDLFSPADSTSTSNQGSSKRFGDVRSREALDSGDAIQEVYRSSGRCRPLGIFSGIFSEFFSCGMPRESTGWTKGRAKALLDLSKRQQSALVDKQDAIDMLEWKLRKLQAMDAKLGPAAGEPLNVLEVDTCSESSQGTSTSTSSFGESSGGSTSGLADLCRNAKQSFSEDSWKADEKRDSFFFPGFKDMTMSERVPLFEMAATRARVAVRYFCKVFMKQMEYSGYSVFRTLAAIEPSAKFMKREHTSFVLEANVNKALYHCFENDSFDATGLTLIIDAKERCAARFEEFQRLRLVDSVDAANSAHADFEPKFLAFCEQKMREIWFLFPWNIVFKDTEARKSFTGAFLDAAKCIWLLHRLASSLYPSATVLRVGKGMEISEPHVERMASTSSDAAAPCPKCKQARVQFMIAPGFQVHQKVIRCQVYEHLLCD